MSEPEVGGGRIEIELDGKVLYLEPRLEACMEISAMAGGLNRAIELCRSFHFESIVKIVGAGVTIDGKPLNPRQRDALLPKAIYEAGVMRVAARCIEFIHVLMNGGKPFADEDGTEDEDDDPLAAAA